MRTSFLLWAAALAAFPCPALAQPPATPGAAESRNSLEAVMAIPAEAPVTSTFASELATGTASPAKQISLTEAIRQAVEQNPGYTAAKQAAAIARGRREQAQAAIRPNFSASASKTWQSRPDVNMSGLGGLFGGGGLFASEVTDKRLTVTQQLLDVRGSSLVSSARSQERASRQDVSKATVDLVATVKTAFFDLLLAGEITHVTRATAQQVERQLKQARLNVGVGTAPRLDVLRAEVQLARAKADLIRADYTREIARETLANLMALETNTPLEPAGHFVALEPESSRNELLERAFAERPDLRAARERLKAAKQTLRAARAGHLPTVTLVAMSDKSLGQRFPLGTEMSINSAAVSVNLPLFDGGLTDGRITEARASERQAAAQVKALEQAVDMDITRASSLVIQARAVLNASQAAVQQASEALDIADEGYRQGVRTYLELLDVQLALAQARTNVAQAARDYSVARAQLDQALGLTTGLELPAPRQASAGTRKP